MKTTKKFAFTAIVATATVLIATVFPSTSFAEEARIFANNPKWSKAIALEANKSYRIIPDQSQVYYLAPNKNLQTTCVGLDNHPLNGWKIGIPLNPIRLGALVMIVNHYELNRPVRHEIIAFVPGMKVAHVKMGPYGGSIGFMVADTNHLDNQRHCDVAVYSKGDPSNNGQSGSTVPVPSKNNAGGLSNKAKVVIQNLSGRWRCVQGDESWWFTPDTGQSFDFRYRGVFISGGGKLQINNDGSLRAKTLFAKDALGCAIPVGMEATGQMTNKDEFYLDGWRLDHRMRRLVFRRRK